MRDYIFNVLSENDLINTGSCIWVLDVTDELSLNNIDNDVDNIGEEMSPLRVDFL